MKRTVQIYLVFLKQGNRPQQDFLLFYKRLFFTGTFVSIGKVTSGKCVFVYTELGKGLLQCSEENFTLTPGTALRSLVATGNPTDGCMGEIMPVVINTKTCIDADDSCTCTAENAAEYPQRGCSFCHKTLLFMRRDLVLNEEPAYTPVHRFDR